MKVFILLVLTFFSIANMYIFIGLGRPTRKDDSRLSSQVRTHSVFARTALHKSLSEQFHWILNNYYQGLDIYSPQVLFKPEVLAESSIGTINIIQLHDFGDEYEDYFLKTASLSMWYNPLLFSEQNYQMDTSYPYAINPPLPVNTPYVILFIKNRSVDNNQIYVVVCGRYVVFVPKNILREIERAK